MSIVQAENLTKIFGSGETTITAPDHVNRNDIAGQFMAFMGPCGCGRSPCCTCWVDWIIPVQAGSVLTALSLPI